MTHSIISDIREIPSEDWNRLAGKKHYSPFLEHEFLASLEESGCASAESGWYPSHFVLKDGDRITAAAPAYIKTHSMGEFIFDQGLAQAVMRMGKKYYPKLVATLPFTPSPGYRILTDEKYDESALADIILDQMKSFRDSMQLGSHSILFADPSWQYSRLQPESAESSHSPDGEFLSWAHQYFLWENPGYRDFEDYLDCFNKNQRRNIRRERASISDQNLIIRHFTGSSLSEDIMNQMYDFYRRTNEQFGPWAAFFLNRDWFRLVRQNWSHRIVIFTAAHKHEADNFTAMSMLVKKNDQLIGRYWGSSGYFPNLHFELCYYAPIEYALSEGIRSFDPGMGSPHKARRGFRSREFMSYHSFADTMSTELFATVLDQANQGMREAIDSLDSSIPWRSDGIQ